MRLIHSLAVLMVFVLLGCQAPEKPAADDRQPQEPQKPQTTFTGTLQSGVVGIGGEHTGWILSGDGATGGIEVDVSKVRDQASANDGKRVTITGRMSQRNYTERGKVPVLIAEAITAAKKP
ncbi:MAG TPA: hypothetical protein VGP94_00585 [Tepidisphaeraceae bacterium]|nr:hypothetical protein [Tepidisphaeraceae bacterium]